MTRGPWNCIDKVLKRGVTFEQARDNTVNVEFVVRLSPLALPTPEHSLALHPDLPRQQSSLSEIIQLPLSNILNHFSSEYP